MKKLALAAALSLALVGCGGGPGDYWYFSSAVNDRLKDGKTMVGVIPIGKCSDGAAYTLNDGSAVACLKISGEGVLVNIVPIDKTALSAR